MARPKSDDPKRPLTLRLPASALARYEAMGDGWRAVAEDVLASHVAPHPEPAPLTRTAPKVERHVNRLKGVWKAP